MSYIKDTVIQGEEIIHEAKVSKWFFLSDILVGMFFVMFGFTFTVIIHGSTSGIAPTVFLIGLFVLIRAYIIYISTELAFTNKRVIAKVGFIKRDTVEIDVSKVETIQVQQGIIGRILNYGTIVISGAGNPSAPIVGIANPLKFRTKLMEYKSIK